MLECYHNCALLCSDWLSKYDKVYLSSYFIIFPSYPAPNLKEKKNFYVVVLVHWQLKFFVPFVSQVSSSLVMAKCDKVA